VDFTSEYGADVFTTAAIALLQRATERSRSGLRHVGSGTASLDGFGS
jgi:hypothetical protein